MDPDRRAVRAERPITRSFLRAVVGATIPAVMHSVWKAFTVSYLALPTAACGGLTTTANSTDAEARRDVSGDAHVSDGSLHEASSDVRERPEASPAEAAATCDIDGITYDAQQRNPNNACEQCQPDASRTAWSGAPANTRCGANGICQDGGCAVCSSPCTTDIECKSRCSPADAGHVNCCDTVTSQCFESASSMCPDVSPPTCAGTCSSDEECQQACPTAPSGTTLCCDKTLGACVPFAQPACTGALSCEMACSANTDCSAKCPSPPDGSFNCCYFETATCYLSPTTPCPE